MVWLVYFDSVMASNQNKGKEGGKKKEKRKGKRRKVKPQTPESANHTHHGKPLDKNYKDP